MVERTGLFAVLNVPKWRTLILRWLSYSLTVFSPSGKLVQIEHALAAVSQGTTSLGIKGRIAPIHTSSPFSCSRLASNGIVIATEKKSSSILIDESMLDKVSVICPNIGIVYSGMGPDFRVLVAKARKSAQAYWTIYGEYPPTRVLTQEIATVMQQATQSGCVTGNSTDRLLTHD
jgi:20S proteasome subunit alpha 2